MKVLLLRGNSLRHQALSSILQNAGHLSAEVVESKLPSTIQSTSSLVIQHFVAREQSEKDFFQLLINPITSCSNLEIEHGQLNSSTVFDYIDEIEFDVTITFGVSILHSTLIQKLRMKY